jgi:hypothetical protein
VKIFIGWSGERSKKIAHYLYEWFPIVIQAVKPYMSTEIAKGTSWTTSVSSELQSCNFGVFCITSDNRTAPWIHFEAGALSKIVESSHVVPILFDLPQSDLQGPLTMFQAVLFNKGDVLRLLQTMNKAAEAAGGGVLEEKLLEMAFEGQWAQLDERIKAVLASEGTKAAPADEVNPILEEILTLSRQQIQFLGSFETVSPVLRQINEQFREVRDALLRTSSLPHPDHFVWRDLGEAWPSFLDAWVKFTASAEPEGVGLGFTGMSRIQQKELGRLLDHIVQLRRPIEYLLNGEQGRYLRWPAASTFTVRWVVQGETEAAEMRLPDLRSALDFACSIRKATRPMGDYWVEDDRGLRVADQKRIEEHCLRHGLV